jgi:hypothetical protein
MAKQKEISQQLSREQSFAQLAEQSRFDMIVVGGGATGLGTALDAASRGLRVAVFESHDFASGTSSRATKLVHGGVRYLAQGHIPLVREALRERSRLLANAPHNAHPLQFVMPSFQWWERPFYGIGLKMYDALSGSHGLGATEFLSSAETREALPGVRSDGLSGGVRYWDGQFNDARLAIDLARTAASFGALVFNYCKVDRLIEDAGKVVGVHVVDQETEQGYDVQSNCVINATGVWVDALRGASGGADASAVKPHLNIRHLVRPSRGVHLVVSRDFMPTDCAMLMKFVLCATARPRRFASVITSGFQGWSPAISMSPPSSWCASRVRPWRTRSAKKETLVTLATAMSSASASTRSSPARQSRASMRSASLSVVTRRPCRRRAGRSGRSVWRAVRRGSP